MPQLPRKSSNKIAILLFGLIGLGFIIGSTWVIYQKNLVSGSTDIYPTWQGGQSFWQEQTSPYDEEIGLKSQEAIYDRPAEAGEDEFQFVYPFYLILYLGPLSVLSFKLAAAIFMEALLLLLALSLVLTLDTLRWLPKPLTLGMSILFVLLQYFSVRGLLLAQPAFLAYAFHIVAYWAIARRYHHLAGVMLALSTIKPQTGFLIVPLLLLWAWFNQRRQIVHAFIITMSLLFGASFALLPSWFSEWIDRALHYQNYTETYPSTHVIAYAIEGLPDTLSALLQVLLSILILIPVGLFWYRTIFQRQNADFLWGIILTMCAGLLIAPRVATTYYVELYPAVFMGLYLLEKRQKTVWIVLITFTLTLGYWVLHIVTAPPREEAGREAAIVYVVFPTLIYGWLLWQRHALAQIDILRRSQRALE